MMQTSVRRTKVRQMLADGVPDKVMAWRLGCSISSVARDKRIIREAENGAAVAAAGSGDRGDHRRAGAAGAVDG